MWLKSSFFRAGMCIGENYKTEGYVINVPPEETPGGDRGSGDHMVPP